MVVKYRKNDTNLWTFLKNTEIPSNPKKFRILINYLAQKNEFLQDDLYGTCPVGIPCSKMGGDCLKCDFNPKCVYGKSYKVNCTVMDQTECVVSEKINFFHRIQLPI